MRRNRRENFFVGVGFPTRAEDIFMTAMQSEAVMEVARYNVSYIIPDFRDRMVRSRPHFGNDFRFAPSTRS